MSAAQHARPKLFFASDPAYAANALAIWATSNWSGILPDTGALLDEDQRQRRTLAAAPAPPLPTLARDFAVVADTRAAGDDTDFEPRVDHTPDGRLAAA